MGLSKPVISTDVVPFARHMENAVVVPKKDKNALAKAMIDIYKNASLREKLSQNALKTAMDFSKEVFCNKYRSLLKAIY